jgi:hypothetical protein
VPAATPDPAPDASGAARRSARAAAASAPSDQAHPAGLADDDRALLAAPFLGGPEQSDVLDWEWAALSHEEDPSVMYPGEDEPGDYEEWLDEVSCVLAAGSGAAAPEPACPEPASLDSASPDPACSDPASPEPAPASPSPGD